MRLHYLYMNQATLQAGVFKPRFERGTGSENFSDDDVTVHFGWVQFESMKNNSKYTIRALLGDARGIENPPWQVTVELFARLRENYTVNGTSNDGLLECLHPENRDRFARADDALGFAAEWILARLQELKRAASATEHVEGAA